MTLSPPVVGCVVIGRNEGERLRRCLESVAAHVAHVVYVDSGSTDGSTTLARQLGADVVELDLSVPFTAARARNAGFARALEARQDLEFVQFVDGDCEVVAGWLERATETLAAQPELAVVCGRRRERYPDASVYNRLCDMEWDTPIGPALACGGDAMFRASALVAVGGYNPTLIAGEEPELCVRIRAQGHRIERLNVEMTLHDAAMSRFGQWWQRAVRAGHAFAEGAHLHGGLPERHWVRESRRSLVWGGLLPAAVLASTPVFGARSLVLLAGYPLTAARVYQHARRRGRSNPDALVQAFFITLAKFPELQGALRFHWGRVANRQSTLIEYKR